MPDPLGSLISSPPAKDPAKVPYVVSNRAISSPYIVKIEEKLPQIPNLQILLDFLDPDLFVFSVDPNQRLFSVDVDVVHILKSGKKLESIRCNTIAALRAALEPDVSSERKSTVILVENISASVVEYLGSTYDLLPEFFTYHLKTNPHYRSGGRWTVPSTPEYKLPPSYFRDSPFYSIEYRRPYHFEKGCDEAMRLRSIVTNTPRGARATTGLPNITIDEQVSVYVTEKDGINVGIILSDKLVSSENAKGHSLAPLTQCTSPSLHKKSSCMDRRRQISCREELVKWIEHMSVEERMALFDDGKNFALKDLIRMLRITSSVFMADANYNLHRINYSHFDESFPNDLSYCLYVARSYFRHIDDQKNVFRLALSLIRTRGLEDRDDIKSDLEFGMEEMNAFLERLQQNLHFLASNISIEQAGEVTKLTKFAFVFVPINTIAAILGIQGANIKYAIFGGLTAFFLIAFAIFAYFQRAKAFKAKRL